MEFGFMFFVNSIMLGAGLAMDAFSVSMANGLNEPNMKKGKMCAIAGVFAFFQFLMPMVGWVCVNTVVQYFSAFQSCVPWVALVLLLFLGGKMLFDGLKSGSNDEQKAAVGVSAILIQGIATSIDALSVGFTIAGYNRIMAFICTILIGAVTFVICVGGVLIGRKFGTKLSDKSTIFGGVILIVIGIEIFIRGLFG